MSKILNSKNLIPALLVCFAMLVVLNSVFTFYNANAIVDNNALKIETETVKRKTSAIITDIIHGADLSVRGFAITKNPQLADPLRLVLKGKDSIFNNLESLLVKQHYQMDKFREMKIAVEDYLTFSSEMIELAQKDSMKQFVTLLNEDRGFAVWKKYEGFYVPLFRYEDSLNAAADAKYTNAISRSRSIQILMLLLGIPTIIFVIRKLRSEAHQRAKLLVELDQNNRKYIFDNGISLVNADPKEVVDESIRNFQQANLFISRISAGDYLVHWSGLTETNQSLNQTNMAGNLLKMREYLKQTKAEDDRRNWAVAGIAKFAEIIRSHDDFKKLGDAIISNLVRYTRSNQGGLFVVNDEIDGAVQMKLLSCYAWDKQKLLDKNKAIHFGDGIVGQCWKEGEPVFLKEVPSDYINITSGLGQATPRCLFVVPLKSNDTTFGVLELASFDLYQQYELDFILEVSKTIAAAIAAKKTAERTKRLLEQSQQHTEAMRGQEEELLQTLEELQATQEGMRRTLNEASGEKRVL